MNTENKYKIIMNTDNKIIYIENVYESRKRNKFSNNN